MAGFWIANAFPCVGVATSNRQPDNSARIRELEHQVQRLMLKNRALWELIREQLHVTETDLERKTLEVDMRDGINDGEVTVTAVKCPTCGRTSSSRHWKCMYCGQEFKKPAMG